MTDNKIVYSDGKFVPENMSEELKAEFGFSDCGEQEVSLLDLLNGGICYANWLWQIDPSRGFICEKGGIYVTFDGEFVHENGSSAMDEEVVATFHDHPELVFDRAWHAYIHGIYYVGGRAFDVFEDGVVPACRKQAL